MFHYSYIIKCSLTYMSDTGIINHNIMDNLFFDGFADMNQLSQKIF
jgi:hypothetical protein